MRLNPIKSSIITTVLCITTMAHAQIVSQPLATGTNFTQPVPTVGAIGLANASVMAAPTNSNAIEFASEAGRIAGIAKACGQDITLLANRTTEAINKLATNVPDKILAVQSFQVALKQAQLVQTSKNIVPCGQVIKDFSNLPILRNDYQQTVIANLNPDMNINASQATPNNSAINQAQPNINYGATSTTPNANQQNSTISNTINTPTSSAATSVNQNSRQNGVALQQYIENKN